MDLPSQPKASPQVISQPVRDELIAYNPGSGRAHNLSPLMASFYLSCNGERSWEELASICGTGLETIAALTHSFVTMDLLKFDNKTTRRTFLGQLTTSATSIALTVAISSPLAAMSGCIDENSGMGTCDTMGVPGFPPTTCPGCCDGQSTPGCCNSTCPTCDCVCTARIRCAGDNCCAGSCLGDSLAPAIGFSYFCISNPLLACGCAICGTTGESACQADCQRARAAACCAGFNIYHCCTNCT